MGIDSATLFVANAIILFVMAAVFFQAGRRSRRSEPYWRSWWLANLVLGSALLMFYMEQHLPRLLIAMLPNGLLIVGFGLRWKAAREFSGRPALPDLVWGPALVFAGLCLLPWISGSYGTVYTIVNILLAGLALAVAWEFWRDRGDGLPSRYGLVLSYAAMGLSFAVRVGQGLFEGPGMGYFLPQDTMLDLHLLVAVLHTASSGGFAVSMAYERYAGELRYAATHDFLTGLLNRRALESRLRRRLAGDGHDFALVLLDIDHFKRINDAFGHAAGDAALRTCASIIRDCAGAGDAVGRIGGEEFAVLLDGVSAADAHRVIERLRATLDGLRMEVGGAAFSLTVSAGICHAGSSSDFDGMMRTADALLYAAKENGRNRLEMAA